MRTRDIKFRVWDQEDKVMIPHESQKIVLIPCMDSYGADTHYPSPRINTNSEKVSMEENWFNNESCFDWASGWLISGRFILMQYTGLKDASNKKIYEDDIVWVIDDGDKGLYRCVWCNEYACFEFRHITEYEKNGHALGGASYQSIHVVGNAYENPELLKEKEG